MNLNDKEMKVEIKEKVKSSYPKLMKTYDLIVLIQSVNETCEKGKGVVMNNINSWAVGDYSDVWIMDEFEDFEGSITLSNH